MNSKRNIAILGGDLRQYTAATILRQRGWEITLWGMDTAEAEQDGMRRADSPEQVTAGVNRILLPLPATVDGVLLNAPFAPSDQRLRLQELLRLLHRGDVIIGGRLPESFVENAEAKGILAHDYFRWEEFQIQNAYTTAEAAVSIAMNQLTRTLRGALVAITGFGRIAKHLTFLLLGMGARITVAARKPADLIWAASLGCKSLALGEKESVSALSSGYDVIYNTVPHWLFDREFLERMDPRTFLIDLASVPGGVDVGAAKELGANVLWATSLPGKYAPKSAGELIADCVDRIFGEEEDRK